MSHLLQRLAMRLGRHPQTTTVDAAFDRAFAPALRDLRPRAVPSDELHRRVAQLADAAQARLTRRLIVRRSVAVFGSAAVVTGAIAAGPRLLLAAELLQASAHLRSAALHVSVASADQGGGMTVTEQFWTEGDDAVRLTDSEVVARHYDKLFYAGSPEAYPVQIGSADDPSPEVAQKQAALRLPCVGQLASAALPFAPGAPQVVEWKRDARRHVRSLILQLPNGDRTAWSWGADGLPHTVEVQRPVEGAWEAHRRITIKQVDAFPVAWESPSWRVRQQVGDGPPPAFATYYASQGTHRIHMATGRIGVMSAYMSTDGVVLITYSQGSRHKDQQLSLRLRGYHSPTFLPLNGSQSAAHDPFYNGTDRVLRARFVPARPEFASQSTALTKRHVTFEIVEPTRRGKQSYPWKVTLRRQIGDSPNDLRVSRPGMAAPPAGSQGIGPYFTNDEPRVTTVAGGVKSVRIERITLGQGGWIYLDCTDTAGWNDIKAHQSTLDVRIDGYNAPQIRNSYLLSADYKSERWMRMARRYAFEPVAASARNAINARSEPVLTLALRDPATGKPVRQTVRLARVPALDGPGRATEEGDVGVQAK